MLDSLHDNTVTTRDQQVEVSMPESPENRHGSGVGECDELQNQSLEAYLTHTACQMDPEPVTRTAIDEDPLGPRESQQPPSQPFEVFPVDLAASCSDPEIVVKATARDDPQMMNDKVDPESQSLEAHLAHTAPSHSGPEDAMGPLTDHVALATGNSTAKDPWSFSLIDDQQAGAQNTAEGALNDEHTPLSSGGTVEDAPVLSWIEDQNADEQELVPDDVDSDSALGGDTASDTTSLAESVFSYRMENGRTYHAYKDGTYVFPNDEREAERLDLQHHLLRLTYKKLYFAPLTRPRRCLDVGTGTGIWAIEFADEHPECQVIGIDLSPNQPNFVPPNVKFMVDDAEDLWLYDEKFDFIHLRLMSGSIGDWPRFFQQAYDNLEPGGWIELQDYGLPVRSFDGTHFGTNISRWGELLCEASMELGRPLGSDAVDNYEGWLSEAGFVEIRQTMFMWPINGWPRDPFMKMLGRWNQINILDGLEGFCLALLTRGLGWKKEEVDVFVAKVSRDLRDKNIHAYFPMPLTWARKPHVGEATFASHW